MLISSLLICIYDLAPRFRHKVNQNVYEVIYSSKQSGVADSQIDRNSIRKKYLLLEINTVTKFLLFKMMLLTGVVYVIIDTCYFFIILIHEWTSCVNELIRK